MIKEEIIEMAIDAGFPISKQEDPKKLGEFFEFAKMVRDDYSKKHARLWLKRIDDAVKKEREECAKLCDYVYKNIVADDHIKNMAFKIRARGQQ